MELLSDPITITVPIYKDRSIRSLTSAEFRVEQQDTLKLVAIDCYSQDLQKVKDLKLNFSRTMRWLLHLYLEALTSPK